MAVSHTEVTLDYIGKLRGKYPIVYDTQLPVCGVKKLHVLDSIDELWRKLLFNSLENYNEYRSGCQDICSFFDSKSGRSAALISDRSCTAEEGSRNDWVLAGENYWPKEKC